MSLALTRLAEAEIALFFFQRWRLSRILARGPDRAFAAAVRIWRRTKVVYKGPCGFGATIHFPYALVLGFIARFPDRAEELFRSGITHESDMVVAYSIVGLADTHASGLERALDAVRGRTQPFRWKLCCAGGEETLAELCQDFIDVGLRTSP